jgi:putative transposase
MAELSRYPWSGHSALMGKVKREWQDTDCVLSLFGQDRYRRRDYEKYVQKGAALGRRPELVGGGLVRSLGGWSEVLALRSRGEKRRSDQRILGDSEFVQDIISGLVGLVKKNLRLSGQRIDMEALAQQVCRKYDISLAELFLCLCHKWPAADSHALRPLSFLEMPLQRDESQGDGSYGQTGPLGRCEALF